MRLLRLWALLFLVIPLTASTQTENGDWRLSLGAAYINQLSKRGIITYQGDQVLPVISLNLGSPRLFISGTSLNYKSTPWEDLILRLRLNYNSTYDNPLYKSTEDLEVRPRRERTTEADLFWEWKLSPHVEFNGNLSQDLVAHHGVFIKSGLRFILGVYQDGLIEPAFYISEGLGNQTHNQYLYGAGSKAGSVVQTVGFSIASPALVDSFYPILEIEKTWLQRGTLINGAFVRPDELENVRLLIWGAVRVW